MEAGQRKVNTVMGIMSAIPEAGLDLTETTWMEGTVCYGASSGFHFLLLYLKLELFMRCGDVHSLFDKYLAKIDQMVSANRSEFFLVPYEDPCFNRKRCGCNAGSTTAIPSGAKSPR